MERSDLIQGDAVPKNDEIVSKQQERSHLYISKRTPTSKKAYQWEVRENILEAEEREGQTEEKSQLNIVENSSDQIKTLCFQPKSDPIIRMQAIEVCEFKSNPIHHPIQENESMHLKKFDREIRTRFEDTSSFPYSVHGIVKIDLGNGSYRTGTGILIGTDLVLTAAHNIYDCKSSKEKYSNIEFIPGMNEQEMPFGIFKGVESYVPEEFLKSWDREDYALLVLEGVPGKYAGYFGLHVAEKDRLKGRELHVIGYPGSVRTKDERNKLKMLSGRGKHQLWGMKGKSWFFEDGENGEFLINYGDILTTPGQSGSGVFYQVEGTQKYHVIGVHVLGREGEGTYNSATWITRKRFSQLQKWVDQSRRNLISRKISQEGLVAIKSIDLSCRDIGDIGVGFLLDYVIPNLKILDLQGNNIGDEGAIGLGKNVSWTNLTTLHLWGNNIGGEGATGLGKNVSWTNLTTLHLWVNNIGDEGATGLGKNVSWTNLTTLYLSENNIDDEGATGLGKNVSWTNLTTLDLQRNNIGDEGATGLGKNVSWTKLTELYLSENKIGDEGATGLGKNVSWTNLTTLDLSENNIGDEGATGLGKNVSWTNLTTLHLSCNFIGDEGATGLGKNVSWTNLTTLYLSENNVGDEGATGLGKIVSWTNLTLYLSENNIGDEGATGLDNKWSLRPYTKKNLF